MIWLFLRDKSLDNYAYCTNNPGIFSKWRSFYSYPQKMNIQKIMYIYEYIRFFCGAIIDMNIKNDKMLYSIQRKGARIRET